MDVQDKLDEIVAFLASARALPMSSSAVVNRAEANRLLEELRRLLPEDLLAAQAVLDQRQAILTEATSNAERLLEAADEEQKRMIAEHTVLVEARVEAGKVIEAAQTKAEQITRDVDTYVDAKLAHLELSVTKILETIRRGREQLAQSGLYAELAAADEPAAAIPARPRAGSVTGSAAATSSATPAVPSASPSDGESGSPSGSSSDGRGAAQPAAEPSPGRATA